MIELRPVRQDDLAAIYRIALETGDAGSDATALHPDGRIVGDLFAAPYVRFCPETGFVVEDAHGVGGYILGALDTAAFEAELARAWWPAMRARYAAPLGEPSASWTTDERWRWFVHHPRPTPRRIAEPFPSHLHIDLLPRLQGLGLGRRLLDVWFETVRQAGSRGAHLGVSLRNARAIRFYRAYGLTEPALERGPPAGSLWFARSLTRAPEAPGR